MNESKCLSCLKELPGQNKLKISKDDSIEIKERFCSKDCYDNWQKLSETEKQKRKKDLYSELEGNLNVHRIPEIEKRIDEVKYIMLKYGGIFIAGCAIMFYMYKIWDKSGSNDITNFFIGLIGVASILIGFFTFIFEIPGYIKLIRKRNKLKVSTNTIDKKNWNLKYIIIGVIGAAAIAFLFSLIPNTNNKKVIELEKTSKEVNKTFHYSIPTDWGNMNTEELKSYKAAYIQSGTQKVKDYSGKSLSISINEIEGIHSEDNKVKLILLDMYIPENSSSYINDMYKESTQKFKWGIDNGQLSKINENKLTIFKDRDCYLNDFELNSGMRMITYLMQNDSLKDNVYQIGIFIEPNTVYKNFETDIQLVFESLEITNH